MLIINKTSIINLPIISKLINTLPNHTQIIFLNNHNQLTSIKTKTILNNIYTYTNTNFTTKHTKQLNHLTKTHIPTKTNTKTTSLHNNLYLLQKNYHFNNNSNINQLTTTINHNNKTTIKTIFQQNFTNIKKQLLQNNKNYITILKKTLTNYKHYLNLLQTHTKPNLIIQTFNKYQLLYTLQKKPFNITKLNKQIKQFIQQKHKIHHHPHSH